MIKKISMIRKIILFVSLCTLINIGYAQSLHDPWGRETGELTGKWVVLNYWALWCGYCRKEIPELNRFYKQNHYKDVVLIGYNYDGVSDDDLKMLLKKHKLNFPSSQKILLLYGN